MHPAPTKITEILQETPPHLLSLINDQSKSPKDWEQARDPLFDVAHALIDLTALAETENNLIWKGRGASRRLAAEDIAKQMAKIFVLGNGKMPGSGAKDNGDPSGAFPTAVHDLFRSIGVPDHYRRPCQEAVAWLKADDHREFNRLLQIGKSKGSRMSLITGTERK